jgi:hypothetical protein
MTKVAQRWLTLRGIFTGRIATMMVGLMILSGCSGGVVQRLDDPKRLPLPPRQQGFLRLPEGPKMARIYVDERFMGRFADYPRRTLLLPAGRHRIQLKARGYLTIYAIVKISSNRPVNLEGALLSLSSVTQQLTPPHPSSRVK